ncbi:MAG: Wzz/FepE/Etk N-terminal domain-containing protein [Bacillota bacterium]|nr:Wzz/FepE/Etk N-terminal domain-containing protein [Bacillota bacterium]
MEDRHYEDEISLKELIMALVKNWKLIVMFIAISAILALGYVFIIADEVYESSIEGIISVPESTSTRYGTYTFPTTNKMDYLNEVYSNALLENFIDELGLKEETVEGFREDIVIDTEEESTRFMFKITGDSPEDAMNRLVVLKNLYLEEIQMKYKESALNYFVREYHVTAKQLEETLLNQKKQLRELETEFEDVSPVITLQKLVTSDPVYAAELAKSRGLNLEDLSGDKMLEEEINPHYLTIQGNIIDLRKTIQDTERAIEKNIKYTNELKTELVAVQNFAISGDESTLTNDMLNVMDSKLQMSVQPSFPRNPIAPRKALTLAIALVLGGMLGVFAAFFKEYWKNN